MSAKRKFEIGDKAVYPAHGVGIIKRIESKEISGNKIDFYVIEIVSSGATVMVPTAQAGKGIRGLISRREVKDVYSILKTPGQVSKTTWNRRFREFSEKLRTGSVADIAEVLRDLNSLRFDKDLSFGEKKMMDKAREMIVTEISAVSSKEESSIEAELDKILLPQ